MCKLNIKSNFSYSPFLQETTQALKKLLRISDGSGKRASDAKASTAASKQDGSRSGDEVSNFIFLQNLREKNTNLGIKLFVPYKHIG